MRKSALILRALASVPALVLLGSLPAAAQDIDNTRFTVYVAPSFMTGERTFAVDDDDLVATDYEAGWKLGFRLAADLAERVSGEVTYNFGRNAFNVQTASAIERTFDINVHQFAANAAYHFGATEDWRPFVTGGLGLVRYSPTDEAKTQALAVFLTEPTRIEADNRLAFNFGGGAERRIGDGPFAVRLDLRDYISGQPTFGLPKTPLSPGGVFLPSDSVVHNVELTVGLTVYFEVP